MFGLLARVPVPVATPIVPPTVETPSTEYVKLVQKLGLFSTLSKTEVDTEVAEFVAALSQMGLRRYDFDAVKRYLNQQYGRTRWGFRALFKCNEQTTIGVFLSHNGYINGGDTKWWKKHNGALLGTSNVLRWPGDLALYAKPIPFPVLRTIDELRTKFPGATFWVSDEAQKVARSFDPFLLVRFHGQQFIIERWDEPGFRG